QGVEPRGSHLRPAGVVDAREENGLHGLPWAATWGSGGASQRKRPVEAAAPKICATTKPGTSLGRIPANVSLAARASVTAGLANEVEEVNQYAAVMYAPTAK